MVLVTCNCLNIKLHLKQNPNISPFDLLPGNYKLSVCLSLYHSFSNKFCKNNYSFYLKQLSLT